MNNEIIQKVGNKFCIDPDKLEAGSFSSKQMVVLTPLFCKCVETNSDEDIERYLSQKAIYILYNQQWHIRTLNRILSPK